MTIKTVTSEDVRVNLRTILDEAIAGAEIVIERYRKPMAVVVNYNQWQLMRRQFLAMLDQRSQEIRAGDYVTQEELDAELKARGILE